jgi:hypothetical protein
VSYEFSKMGHYTLKMVWHFVLFSSKKMKRWHRL